MLCDRLQMLGHSDALSICQGMNWQVRGSNWNGGAVLKGHGITGKRIGDCHTFSDGVAQVCIEVRWCQFWDSEEF